MSRLITVAIHTYEKAVTLRSLLENEGIEVVFHNVNLQQPVISSGIRVRIHEHDLPLALRIIENRDIFSSSDPSRQESSRPIVVPIDFSDYSFNATKIAFGIAEKHKTDIVLLHAYIDPYIAGNMQLTNSLTYEISDNCTRQQVEATAHAQMSHFTERIKDLMKAGTLPLIKFSTEILEGVPEDAIAEYAKINPPYLVVMGTRGSSKKEQEMIGSVTAEVLDKGRFSVFAIPETIIHDCDKELKNILFFSNLDQEDILAMDTLYRIFPDANPMVTIVHVPGKKRPFERNPKESIPSLLSYCRENFKNYDFDSEVLSLDKILDDYNRIEKKIDIDMIVLPNKKKNIFSRLFNPSLAHKILFAADIPMLVIPV